MKVLFIDSVHPVLYEDLCAAGFECLHLEHAGATELQSHYATANGIVIRSKFPVDGTFLEQCPQLKFVARSGAGMENIDMDLAQKKGIALFNSPEGNCNAVGEHALALLLGGLNKLSFGHRNINQGTWDREGSRGLELDGRTVGIIGFGNNGSAFAKKLRGFDVKVLAYDKYRSDYGSNHVTEASLNEIQEQCDVISFHVPQTPETIGYFNQDFLIACAKPIFLLNVSRGRVVELEAVQNGLNQNKIIGAGLDVFEFESASFEKGLSPKILSDYQSILHHPSVICSPHVAGWTKESYFKLSKVLSNKILNYGF